MYSWENPTEFQQAVIALLTIFAVARLGRLLVHDHWPPVEWLRQWWDRHVVSWNLLLHCHFCITVWLAFGSVLWGWAVHWNIVWILVHAGLAASYAAAYVVTYDGDDG